MNHETLLIVILSCVALIPITVVWGRIKVRPRLVTLGMLLLWIAFPLIMAATAIRHLTPSPSSEKINYRPIEERSSGYVGSDTCRSCHPHQHATWHASYHRTMTQLATPATVIGEFDTELRWEGKSAKLWRHEDGFGVDLELPREGKGKPIRMRRPVVMTTGSHHMQAYWYPILEDSRYLGMLPFIYLKEDHRWIPRNAAFLIAPAPPRGGFDEAGRWNDECIRCHTTHGRTRTKMVTETKYDWRNMDTRVAELGIACEACHGPGEKHALANRWPTYRYRQHWSDRSDETIVHPARLSHELSSQVCGQCHGIWVFHGDEAHQEWWKTGWTYRPGEDLADSTLRILARCNPDFVPDDPDYLDQMFWSDGMVRVSGREYNGLIESPCFQRGELSCLHCHQMHMSADDPRPVKEWANDQLAHGMDSNQACLQCHPDLDNQTRLIDHSHHPVDSAGSNCYNCHMSYTTYGLLKSIRSHQIDVPSVAASLETGRPNACNQCHLDKTLAWTAEHLAGWYGISSPALDDDERTIAASVLWSLRGDAGQRALMAWSFGWASAHEASGTEWMVPYLSQLMNDPYDAVRYIAYRSLRRLPGYDGLKYDFLGGVQHYSAVTQQVAEPWSRQPKNMNPQRRESVLMDARGRLMRDRARRLLQQRDDRPINLAE